MNQDLIEKNYYESLMVGHYIDVRYSEHEWKIAKITERDKRYAVVVFDGTNTRDQQVLLQSFKVAPLRMWTEGYTGQTYKAYRPNPTPIQQYKTHLQILQQTYIKDTLPHAFTINQYLRGELFVLVHSLLCRDDLKEEEGSQAMKFLIGFIEFVVKLAERAKKLAPEYFSALSNNKFLYLTNEKIAIVNSLEEMLVLLNIILRVETPKVINFHKSKFINVDVLNKFFLELGKVNLFADLFNLNDGNAKWLSFGIHKKLYLLLKRFSPKFTLPVYKLRDYQEVLQIYSFVLKEDQKENTIQENLVKFIIDLLKEQSTFQAKLKGLQELKKIVEEQTKFYFMDKKTIFNLLSQHQVLDHMTSQYNFNGEIFKRFIPILAQYCKQKQIPQKNINQLFKISSNRHESEVIIIQQIICSLSQFVQVESLDSIYAEIIKNSNINSEQTLKFVKNFTINAIANYSQQKSFIASFFKKTKNSGKYGFFGLDLFFKELQDDGCFSKQNCLLVFQMIKEIFSKKQFQGERFKYISTCIGWIQKSKNYGQGIKIIDNIISTYPSTTYFDDSKKEIIERLINKHNFLEKLLLGIKGKISQVKFTMPEIIKYIYDFLESYQDFLVVNIKISHIQFLWSLDQKKLLSQFLKKSKGDGKKKFIKKLDENIQDDILNKLTRKANFYTRELIIEEFQALNEIFISYNLLKKKIEVSERGYVRYLTPQMQGYQFYFDFIEKMSKNANINKIIKKTINIFLRPKEQKDIEMKINTWKMCLLKIVDRLKQNPQACLNAIQIFFQMCQGAMIRQNITVPQGNVEVIVSNDNHQKTFILPKSSTIWRLRKQIMIDFNLHGDFTMYSNNMRRDISFTEEEEFSLNALPLQYKGPSISIIGRKKEKHIQVVAYEKFKELIQKEEMFYERLFGLNSEQNQELFWKTVDLLPVNRVLVRKIENCQNFKKKNWNAILKPSAIESLQYHLNIIFDLMERNKKWVSLFYSTQGLTVIIQCLGVQNGEKLSERITNRCLVIMLKVFEVVDKIEAKMVEQCYLTLLAKLIYVFKRTIETITISLETVNYIFSLLNKLSKEIKADLLDLQTILNVLTYGIFKPKDKHSTAFIQSDFQHYLINNYSKPQQKKQIFQYILGLLDLDLLITKPHCEMMFVFFIDYMNTFIEEEQKFINEEGHLRKIEDFVVKCLKNSSIIDTGKNQYHPLIFGSFKLLIYTLNNKEHKYDLQEIFNIIMNEFLFNKQQRRLKHEVTIKLVYQTLKKILFLHPKLVERLCAEIVPQLVKSPWRKNLLSSWSIESKRQEKSVYCGLENLGATCYINCLIQQLFHIEHFRQHFLSIKSEEYRPMFEQNQIYQLQYIFSSMKHSSKKSLSIKKFCDSFITYQGVPINPMVQSDADEFFNTLMEKIQSFLKINQRHDVIENTFQGKLSNQLNCQGCPHKSQKQQHFLSIGVNIRGKKCLQEALNGYVEGQILDGDNAYFCEICEKKVRTLKRLCIKKLPNILTIVLKRFEFNYDQMRKIKINSYLKYPEILNMQKYTADYLAGDNSGKEEDFTYALRGTVIHSGTSQGGHYYSFAKPTDKWYSFNDEFIDEISSKKIEEDGYGGEDKASETQFKFQKHKNAYILFYEKIQTSNQYHRNEPEILNDFTQSIKKEILTENNNADFLSVILDDHFIRLTQNISCIENQDSFKFTMLYFHTVVLRDKNKEEHIPNYYRIISAQLQDQAKSQWYLKQMNHKFFKEFMIEAPRVVRFISTSLAILAMQKVKNVPDNIFTHGVFSLRKTGMTPFAKIFKELSKTQAYRQRLIDLSYPSRVIAFILEQTNSNFQMNEVESFDSYFGSDCSDKEKDREVCFAAMTESLAFYDIPLTEAMQMFNKHFSRNGTKTLASILSKIVDDEQIGLIIGSLQADMMKQGDFKREDVERYMFFIRAICLSADESNSWRITKCADSLKTVIYQCRSYYDPVDTILREINYIGFRNQFFCKRLREVFNEKQSGADLIKSLKYWLKQAEKPLSFAKSDDFKRRVSPFSIQQKIRFENLNRLQLEGRLRWIIEKDYDLVEQIDSDIDGTEYKDLVIRNKKFKVKEHFGLLKRVEIDGQQKWATLEKQDLDLYAAL